MCYSLVPFVFYFSILLTTAIFGSFLDSISAFNCPPITAVAFQQQKKQLHTYTHIYQSTFSSLSTSTSASASSATLLKANTEFEFVKPIFSGEMMFMTDEATNINTKLSNDNDNGNDWNNSQRRYERSETRKSLMDSWLLPLGMSKESWDDYANAAIRAEEKVYAAIPHFLRLHSKDIIESVNGVLYTLGSHPNLMSHDQLRDGYESIRVEIIKTKIDNNDVDDDDSTIALAALDACRETEELFLEARMNWIQLSNIYDNHYHSNNSNSNNNTE